MKEKAMRYAVLGALVVALLAACAPMNQPTNPPPVVNASPLAGPVWVAIEIAERPVLTQATLQVAADGGVSGTSGCNKFAGGSTVIGEAISFDDLAATKMACPDQQMEQEFRYFQALTTASRYRLQGDALWLLDGSGATLVLYRR